MLSIRTQDRMALVPYDNQIYITRLTEHVPKTDGTDEWEKVNTFTINIYIDKVSYIPLGKYATKERALEVLDEIVNYVLGKLLIPETAYYRADHLTVGSNPYIETKYTKIEQLPQIYQMPKE